MVVILQDYKFLVQLFDVHPSAPRKVQCQLMVACYFVMEIPLVLAPINSPSFEQMTYSLTSTVACVLAVFFVINILVYRDKFDVLEVELQDLVYESGCDFELR